MTTSILGRRYATALYTLAEQAGSVDKVGQDLRDFAASFQNSRELRNAFENAGRAAVHKMERFMNTLGSIASAAPLLGLFGTVVGMIEIFGSQNASGANPAQLAHGISVALYNTGFGLAIAMPALVAYRHFRALVDSFIIDMELQAVKFVDVVHGARK